MTAFTESQRADIIKQAIGKTLVSMEYDEDDGYWTAELDDGTEFSFRFMAELV